MPSGDFPVIEESISFPSQISTPAPYRYWTSMTSRTIGSNKTRRGKQNELDTVQTGEYDCVWSNVDGALNPLNSGSPFFPAVLPFRAYRKRAQWPATPQLLTADQATMGGASGLPAGTRTTALNMACDYDPIADLVADRGNTVMLCAISGGAIPGHAVLSVAGWTCEPGATFSFQGQARNIVAGTTLVVDARFLWVDVAGRVIGTATGHDVTLTGADNSPWSPVVVSATAPANCAGAIAGLYLVTSPPSACQIYCDAFQVERSPAPTAWVRPGTWYPLYSGWPERWPQAWEMEGTFSEVTPTIIDSFGYLSQTKLRPPFHNTVLSRRPSFFYPLDDPSGSAQFADLTGSYPPAPAVDSPYGAGSLKAGSGVTASGPGGSFLGAAGPVVTFANVDSHDDPAHSPATFLSLDAIGITGPLTGQGWTRMVAFRCEKVPPQTGILWAATVPTFVWPLNYFSVAVYSSALPGLAGCLNIVLSGTATATYNSPASVCDGNWHFVCITCDPTGTQVTIYLDGVPTTFTPAGNASPIGVSTDILGAAMFRGSNQISQGFQGDLAHVGQFPRALRRDELDDLYTAWRTAYAGDSTGARYQRILDWAGYQGARSVAAGNTTSMGPASDITGSDALSCLQNVVVTENGNHYIAADGTAVFEARGARIGNLTPRVVFGENVTAGEIPYEDVGFDFDVTKTANDIKVTQYGTNQVFSAFDRASQEAYGTKSFARTINSASALECTDAANYFTNRLKQPSVRLNKIRIHPSARPGGAQGTDVWAACLGLELSTLVTVMRRPPGQPPIVYTGFIESIAWSMEPRSAFVDLEISPAAQYRYWVHGALHTTVSQQATAGSASATLSALPDAGVNPFSASVPAGLRLTLEPGTAREETVTVLSVAPTTPGYTTASVQFTTSLAFTHPAGCLVCEALPSGQRDPTAFDSACVWDRTTVWGY